MPSIAALLIQVLVTYGPAAYKAVVELIHKENPSKQDFLDLLNYASQKSYDDYVHPQPAPGPSA